MDPNHNDEAASWREFGEWLEGMRNARRLSIREAANRAGFSEGLWRMLESGGREQYGTWVLPNPGDDKLHGLAEAIAVPPQVVFARVGRELRSDVAREARAAAYSGDPSDVLTTMERILEEMREQRERLNAIERRLAEQDDGK